MKIQVKKISTEDELNEAFLIRKKVFVEEQHVPAEREKDEFEDISFHFLAKVDDLPVGAARWRITTNGVKLERFAVLKEVRGLGIGSALVEKVLEDIDQNPLSKGIPKYLNAQLEAVPLYKKFHFEEEGDIFEECAILHKKMHLA